MGSYIRLFIGRRINVGLSTRSVGASTERWRSMYNIIVAMLACSLLLCRQNSSFSSSSSSSCGAVVTVGHNGGGTWPAQGQLGSLASAYT